MDDKMRALLGDREAAKQLTDAGVLVACPMCGDTPHITTEFDSGYFWCECPCGVETGACPTEYNAMLLWNTRAPILSAEEIQKLEEMNNEH